MPNTLAHIGIQGLLTRTINKQVDLKWICLAAIIPDLPWVGRRLVMFFRPDLQPYDVKLYASVQSSLLFCLLLSGFFALLAKRTAHVFWTLCLGSLLHLLLDASQIKWANGVHLLAPFDWQQINYGVFWPHSAPTYALSLFGLVYFVYYWRESISSGSGLAFARLSRLGFAGLVLVAYASLPLLFMADAQRADSHFIKTLRNTDSRTGRYIELDRAYYFPSAPSRVKTDTGEILKVLGMTHAQAGSVSLQGEFVAQDTIRVQAYQVHPAGVRDGLSVIGLLLVCMLWAAAISRASGRD